MDIVTREVRARMMSNIRREHTAPELYLRREIFMQGTRYVPHAWWLPGCPDLLFPRYSAVAFVHGCFWHRHLGCKLTATPQSNRQFWTRKFAANVARDTDVTSQLLMLGFRVAVVWECALRRSASSAGRQLVEWLQSSEFEISIE